MWSILSIKIKHISVHLTSECLYTFLLLEVPVRHTGPYRQTLSPGHRHRSHLSSRPQKEYWGQEYDFAPQYFRIYYRLALSGLGGRQPVIRVFIVMVALWNRADHYIFILWFLLLLSFFLFSSPNLSRRRLDVCHTCTHGVVLVWT